MRYVLIAVGVVVGLLVLGFVALIINLWVNSARQRKRTAARLAPVTDAVTAGRMPDPDAVFELAANPETRNALFVALRDAGKADYFPPQFATREAFAESNLVDWLGHPNELTVAPDEIELVKVVTIPTAEAGDVEWYLFKFRVRPPHWAADKGWMAGAAGPYPKGGDPTAVVDAPGTFSELESMSTHSPDEHVHLMHEAAVGRGALNDLKQRLQTA